MGMVNAEFRDCSPHGFEMVEAHFLHPDPKNQRQSKIYDESGRLHFWQIFAKLISMQTLALYLGPLVVARPRQCVGGNKKRTTGRKMWFLLRLTFWLGLVLVLLPRDKAPESAKLPQIGASEAVLAATAAVSDMSQFCKRQPTACEVGGQAATVIGQRAAEGARKVYDIITDKTDKAEKLEKADKPDQADKPHKIEKKAPGDRSDKKAPDHTGSIGSVADVEQAVMVEAPRDTLTADDLAVEWRPPSP